MSALDILSSPIALARPMIDYSSCRIQLPRPLPFAPDGRSVVADGCTVKLDRDGRVQSSTPHRLGVVGSFEAKLHLRAVSPVELEVTGNPVKFLQGHNLYGPNSLLELLWEALERALPQTPAGAPLSVFGVPSPGDLRGVLTRVDLTHMFALASLGDVLSWLRTAELAAHIARRGKGVMTGNTLVMGHAAGKSFTRWQIVLYSKGCEVRAHPLPGILQDDPAVMEWVERSLRVEVRLGRLELDKLGLRSLEAWRDSAGSDALWRSKVDQLEFNLVEPVFDLESIPQGSLRNTYLAWTTGADLRNALKRRTFFLHRSKLLELAGVDISVPPPSQPTAKVIPLRRVLDVQPVGRPAWADRIDAQLREAGSIVLPFAA